MGPICEQRRMGPNHVANKNIGQKLTDEFLKLPIVSEFIRQFFKNFYLTEFQVNSRENLSFHNSYSFLKNVDQLLIVDVTSDRLDEDGNTMNKKLELWHCDPTDCVKSLIGNPTFKDYISESYVAKHVYMDDEGKVRIFDEMWTGNWWWDTQV